MPTDYTGQGGDPNCGAGTIFIGELTIEKHVVDVDLCATYDGQPAIVFTYSDGSMAYCLKSAGATMMPLTDKTKVECKSCGEGKYFEIVRLDSTLTNLAVPARSAVPGTAIAASTMTPGNRFVLTGGFDSFNITPLRDTDVDSIVVLKMGDNELEYRLGEGCLFDTDLPFLDAIKCTEFTQEIEICVEQPKDANGDPITDCNAYVELLITRTA